MLTAKEASDLLEEVADQIRKANLGEQQITFEELTHLVSLHNELYTAWQNALKTPVPYLGETPFDILAEDNAWARHVAR